MAFFSIVERRTSVDGCVLIAACAGLLLGGCFNAFPLKKDAGTGEETDTLTDTETFVDTNTANSTNGTDPIDTSSESGSALDTNDSSDTSNDTGTASVNDTGSETKTQCPAGIELTSSIEFTEVSSANIGATEYIDTCPIEQIIIGFEGFLREPGVDPMAHGRIRAICGAPSIRSADENCIVEITPVDSLPLRGIAGDIEWTQTCPDNEVILGFKTWTGNNIDCLAFRCVPLVIANDGGGYAIELGPPRDMEPVGNTEGGSVDFWHDCPDGQVATTTKLEADHFLRAFSLGCQAPSLTD